MNINLADFPKSREKVREVVKAQLVAIQAEMIAQIPKEMEFEVPEILPQQVDLTIEYLFKNNKRFLYDIFDTNNILLGVYCIYTPKLEDIFFSISINNIVEQDDLLASTYKNRIEAEDAGFLACFKLLEEKL